MQTTTFNGLIPKEGPVELERGYGVEAENLYISTEKFLQPLRDAKEITETVFDIYGNIFKGNIVTLIKKGDIWIAWDHYVSVVQDFRNWDSIYAFIFTDSGKVYRSSDKWVIEKIPPKEIGIDAPTKPLDIQKDTDGMPELIGCPSFCKNGAYQGDVRSYTVTYVNDMEEESQALTYTDPIIVKPNEEGSYKLVDNNIPPNNAIKRNIYRSISTNSDRADNIEDASIFLYVGTTKLNEGFIDNVKPLELGYELSTTLQLRIPKNVKGVSTVGDNRNVYWTGTNILYISFPRLPHTVDERLNQHFPSCIIGAYSAVNTREGEHTYDLYVFTEEYPYLVTEITTPSNERVLSVNQISIDAVPLNPRAVCSVDGDLLYASKRGLIMFINGNPKDISAPFFSKEEWRKLGNNIELAYHEEELLIITPIKTYVMSISNIFQDKIPSLTTTSLKIDHIFDIAGKGLIITNKNRYFIWNNADYYLHAKWTSARFRSRELWRPNIIKIDAGAPLEYNKQIEPIINLYFTLLEERKVCNIADFLVLYPKYYKYREYIVYMIDPIIVKLYREGECVYRAEYSKNEYLRIPRLRRGIYWQISIYTRYPVYRIMLEKSIMELSDIQQKNEYI